MDTPNKNESEKIFYYQYFLKSKKIKINFLWIFTRIQKPVPLPMIYHWVSLDSCKRPNGFFNRYVCLITIFQVCFYF